MPDLNTQRVETGAIDEQTCRTSLTQQWLLECKEDIARHPIRAYNLIEVLICGEEGFGRIAADLQAASESIEIVCWGFDPAMEVTRGDSAHWPRGQTLGALLEGKAREGVKVRLLAWYDALGSMVQNNLIGHSEALPQTRQERATMGPRIPGPVGPGQQPRDDRHDHCVLWWRRALAGDIPNLEIRLRAGNTEKVKASLERAEIAPGDLPSGAAGSKQGLAHERLLIEKFATHHQKTILIDYEREEGRKAVGYVMGLNSVTDYWDSPAHHFNDPRREVDWTRKSKLAEALGSSRVVSRDPYQDYAARLRGEVLQDVERNFSSAWWRAQPGYALRPPLVERPMPLKLPVRPGPARRIQVVRTQPEEGDLTIQRAYWQATRSARSYIYIENQYFYFEAWARHLKATRHALMAALAKRGIDKKKAGMLHVFVVIPWPEDNGMIPRTYDTVKSLGQAASMPYQRDAMDLESRRHAAQQVDYERQLAAWRQSGGNHRGHPMPPAPRNAVHESADRVRALQEGEEGELGYRNARTMQFEGLGLKALLARMVSFNDPGKEGYLPRLKPEQNYRQVYIHSKLAIVDDTWFTLGSANLNVRSMAADSEINVSVENGTVAADLRRRVWGLMTGDKHAGGGGTPKEVALAFKNWKTLMADNAERLEKVKPLVGGFLIPFEDDRVIEFRHG